MSDAEFDRHAGHYRSVHGQNIAITGEEPEYFAQYKMRDLAALYARAGLPPQGRVLDFGSGIGASVAPFRQHLPDARLTCADVSSQSLALLSEQHAGAGVEVALIEGVRLPFDDSQFDAAFACCVFHHIPHDDHPAILQDLRRVVRPGGLVMVYEHNPYNPLTVRAVRTCPLDENAVLIHAAEMKRRFLRAGYASADVDFRVFFPAGLRALRGLENHLRWLPLGAQYFVAART
jgi:SAM-dependent methyltransferase